VRYQGAFSLLSLSFSFPWCFLLWVFSALLVLSDAPSFFLVCRRALCCLGLFYVGLFSVRTFFCVPFFRYARKTISSPTEEKPSYNSVALPPLCDVKQSPSSFSKLYEKWAPPINPQSGQRCFSRCFAFSIRSIVTTIKFGALSDALDRKFLDAHAGVAL
jgi:hypothetical protein